LGVGKHLSAIRKMTVPKGKSENNGYLISQKNITKNLGVGGGPKEKSIGRGEPTEANHPIKQR